MCWRFGGKSAVGARIEVPRRVGYGEGVPLWEYSSSPEKFSIFELKKASFGASGVTFAVKNGNWLGY